MWASRALPRPTISATASSAAPNSKAVSPPTDTLSAKSRGGIYDCCCPSEKTKTGKNPLRRMQNVSCEPWTLYPSENPSSKLGYFQTATSSPYRVLHPAQGDKQKKQTLSSTTRNTSSTSRISSSATRNTSSVAVMLYTIPFLRWIHLLCTSTHRLFLLFIALQRMDAFCKKVLSGFRFGR